jgi:V8-like Glu-specific endopeptidase
VRTPVASDRNAVNKRARIQLSPAGKNDWGPNQADNDRDHTVDHDERLKITDTAPGMYDVKFVDKSGRTCVVPNIQVTAGSIFSIEEKDLKGCSK